MLAIKDVLIEGEVCIGDYNMEIARWKDGKWSTMIPPLYVIMTDYRLILQQHSRKSHEPASIPAEYITDFQEFTYQFRHGLILRLKTGQGLALFIPNMKREEIVRNMHTITAPTATPKSPKIQLDLGDLKKLIDYVSGL